jgi:hypothetical protein
LSAVCFFLQIVGPSHRKMLATEQCGNIKFWFCYTYLLQRHYICLRSMWCGAMKKTQDHDWHKRLHDGHVSVKDKPHCRQPSTAANDENVYSRQTNKEMTVKILHCIRGAVKRNHPEKCPWNRWFLLHDITFAYWLLTVRKYLPKHSMTVLEHLPYSPDLSLPDFFLFPQLKSVLKGLWFASTEEVTAKATKALTEVSKDGFQECFRKLYRCWQSVSLPKGTTLKDV